MRSVIKGNFPYADQYYPLFGENYRRYANVRARVDRKLERVLQDPYHNTEYLDDKRGHLNLRGCRSVRIDRNFRIIFVICEECRNVAECSYCFCEGLADKTVVFLTIGPHERAYAMK
jgi:mRNA-degrading endonuclease RelE of RelBE toxin-antitoxin system